MSFPEMVSLTLTNACNLRCRMCGQWSETGYMHQKKECLKQELQVSDWIKVVDELYEHQIGSVLLRGGGGFSSSLDRGIASVSAAKRVLCVH